MNVFPVKIDNKLKENTSATRLKKESNLNYLNFSVLQP
jgi:hypothetical protein